MNNLSVGLPIKFFDKQSRDNQAERRDEAQQRKEGRSFYEFFFTVPGEPQCKKRPRVMRTGHSYTPKETIIAENAVEMCARNAGIQMMHGNVKMNIVAYFGVPATDRNRKSGSKLDGKWCTKNKDWDNIGKMVSDALNGVAYDDDKQVVWVTVEKVWSLEPRIEVRLEEI